jgi:RimJ/RimL family protein N-acetyltransferase
MRLGGAELAHKNGGSMGEVIGYKIILEPLMQADISPYLHAFVPEVRSVLRVPSLDHEYIYLKQRLDAQYHDRTFFYCIKRRACRSFVGCVEIRDAQEFAGQLYTWVHPQWQSANYFQEAMYRAAKDYFTKTSATTISAHIDCSNKRSWHALKKAGFAHYARIPGAFEHQYVMMLRNPY